MTEDEEMRAVAHALSGAMAAVFGEEAKVPLVLIWGTPGGGRVHTISNCGEDLAKELVAGTAKRMELPSSGDIDIRKTS
jgi:uncharacterized protein (DUF2147 family)